MMSFGGVLEEQVDQVYNLCSMSNQVIYGIILQMMSSGGLFQLEAEKYFTKRKGEGALIPFIDMYSLI